MNDVKNVILSAFKEIEDNQKKIDFLNELKVFLHSISPIDHPIDLVLWVHPDNVKPNDYNPNSVAGKEMGLLYTSIKHDGYTQPIVTCPNEETGSKDIVDGFHRYFTGISNLDILAETHGRLPVTQINKGINDRMASTVRHNRARGKHSVDGMSNMVFKMLDNGWKDEDVCNLLGMEAEELLKLKHITGFSKLFKDAVYNKSWQAKNQLLLKKKYFNENPEEAKTLPNI